MPARRSRTTEWRKCLRDIRDRGGSIEIAIASADDPREDVRHLIWRVRLLDTSDTELLVEQPSTLGQVIPLKKNIEIAAVFSIGQNRWMFTTTTLGTEPIVMSGGNVHALILRMPKMVERCQRRSFYRVNTASHPNRETSRMGTPSLRLPQVDAWPLLDPASVVVAERDNELRFEAMEAEGLSAQPPAEKPAESEQV